MKRSLFALLSVLVMLSLMLGACGSQPQPTPAPQGNNFLPLPPPAMATNKTTLFYSAMGGGQLSQLVSPRYNIQYVESVADIGKTCSEIFEHKALDLEGTTQCVRWGDWQGGEVTTAESFSADDEKILGGTLELYIKGATLIQWLTAGFGYTIDRSYVQLVYVSPEPGQVPRLQKVVYAELWGPSTTDAWAMGVTAIWEGDKALLIAQQFHAWGFWESYSTPFDQVTAALESARDNLKNANPSLMIIDRDSARELIGRQSGFVIERDGQRVGQVDLMYRNNFGTSPNTKPIGSGALSRIEWTVGTQYYALLVLTPQLSPFPTTLYIFVDDQATADQLEAVEQWVTLYPQLRQGTIPHVIMALHAIGTLTEANSSTSVSFKEGDNPDVTTKEISVKLGTVGGVTYSCLGQPTHEQITLARSLLSLLGKNGIKAIGLYYPYIEGSGSGLDYYLAGLQILTSPPETVLKVWDQDVGVIDRAGMPSAAFVDSLLGQ